MKKSHQIDNSGGGEKSKNKKNKDDNGGGGGDDDGGKDDADGERGGGKYRKFSPKNESSNKNESKDAILNVDEDCKDELSDATTTISTIDSLDHGSSTATATIISLDRENTSMNISFDADEVNDVMNIQKLSLMQQHQQSNQAHQQQLHNRRPSRTLSEPIDDYYSRTNKNIASSYQPNQPPSHHYHPQHHFRQSSPFMTSDYQFSNRISADPYLLEEATRNLIGDYHSNDFRNHQHHHFSNQAWKNFTQNNMSSIDSCTFQQQSALSGPYGVGSMYSLNMPSINYSYNNQMDKYSNYHMFHPSQQPQGPCYNRNNCCRGSVCSDFMSVGYYPPYHSLCSRSDSYQSPSPMITTMANSAPTTSTTSTTLSTSASISNAKNTKNNCDNQSDDPTTNIDKINTNNNNNNNTMNYYHMDKSMINDENVQHQKNVDEYYHQQQQQNNNGNKMDKMNKIIQLESMVNILRNQLLNTEDLFKKALISKKTIENTNCDLLSIIDKLKLDIMQLENRHKSSTEQCMKYENELEQMKRRLLEKDTEISSLRLTMAKIVRTTGYVLSENELALLSGKTIASDYIKNKYKDNYHELMFNVPSYTRSSNYFYSEPSSRRESSGGLSMRRFSPVAPPRSHRNSNVQQQLSPSLAEHRPSPPPSSTMHNVPNAKNINDEAQQQLQQSQRSSMLRRSTSFEDMKLDCQQQIIVNNNSNNDKNSFATLPHNTKPVQMHNFNNVDNNHNDLNNQNYHHTVVPLLTTYQMTQSLIDDDEQIMTMNNNINENFMDANNSKTRAYSTPNSPLITVKPSSTSGRNQKESTPGLNLAMNFGKKFNWLKRNKRAASAPELAPDDESICRSRNNSIVDRQRIQLDESKPKGLKRIFSRKRSTSSLAGISDSFSRGGLRATSGPRLGFNSQEKRFQNVNIPFSNWGTTLVADWFAMIGLGMYINECKRWCKSGEHLMRATSLEVEKELGIKNSLHRKKLRLAVAAMNEEEDDLLKCAGKLDYLWVARWLDDIGLPQYKESFIDARIDGRVLHYLNIEDLLHLKVTNQLHFASIRAAIRVLRENNYNGQCLKRRAASEEVNRNEWSNAEVAVWSSHRIMEWLRSIDLSEYAPNLRGSGVHGALILYENAFNADLFATLLSIPTNKTLLRRHIASKFKQLIGETLSKKKHEYELMPNYQPLIPGAKIKAYKKGHFTLRKKRADYELTDYVCPMTLPSTTPVSLTSKYNSLLNNTNCNDNNEINNEETSTQQSTTRQTTPAKEESPISVKSNKTKDDGDGDDDDSVMNKQNNDRSNRSSISKTTEPQVASENGEKTNE